MRRRVSILRRVTGIAVLLALIAGAVFYRHATHPERLRRYAEHWLREFTGGQVEVRQVRLELFRGLSLVGVTLASPVEAKFDPSDESLEARTLFRCQSVFLRIRPLSVLTGNLVVPEIVAVDPELQLVRRMSDGAGNWAAMWHARGEQGPPSRMRLPTIRLRNARVSQYRLDERGRSGGSLQVIWADAQPARDDPQTYDLQISKLVSSDDEMVGETARLRLNTQTMSVSGGLPTMSIDQVLFTAPPEMVRWLDLLRVQGLVRPESFAFGREAAPALVLTLRGGSCAIPLGGETEEANPEDRYLRFNQIAGTLRLEGRQAEADLQGTFHQAPVTVKGRMQLRDGNGADTFQNMGFEFEIGASDVPLPRNEDAASPAESRFVRRWKRLANFVRDFDGIGPVDLSIQLRKVAGSDEGVEFVEGHMYPKGVSARYLHFPYRINDLRGDVHFRQDGTVGIHELAGVHGDGRIVVDGWDGGFKTQQGELTITGRNIRLDDDLRRCLTEEDQALCRSFNVEALMDLDVKLTRPDAPPGTPNNPWRSTVDVTFRDGSVRFEGFPYPLNSLAGTMRIGGGGLQIHEVRARHEDARVAVRGHARWGETEHPELDLALTASDVPLDSVLANALPDDLRGQYLALAPAGLADLTGRLHFSADRAGIEYDLGVGLREAALVLPGTSARMTGVRAGLRILPERVVVERLNGAFGSSPIELSGSMSLLQASVGFDLRLRSDDLLLDEPLRAALPPGLQESWDMVRPSGRTKIDLTCRSADNPPGASSADLDYTLRLEPQDCSATYAEFPLPVTGVRGTIVVARNRISLQRITGRHADGPFELGGSVDLHGSRTDVQLSLRAQDVAVSEQLRKAVPWRLRRIWNDITPSGRLDVSLDRLTMGREVGKPAAWEFAGEVRLHDAAMKVGVDLSDVSGRVHGSGKMDEVFSIDAGIELERVRVDERLATDVAARASGSGAAFDLRELRGRFYGGSIIGEIDLDYGRSAPRYGVSLTARDVGLADFLNARLEPGEEPVRLKGRLEGNLSLAGVVDAHRRGGGAVVIRSAEVLKVPQILQLQQAVKPAGSDLGAFHDATLSFTLDNDELIFSEVDLRGRALSLVGAGRVRLPRQELDLTLLVGPPLKLPRFQVLSDLMEGVARELVEVRVEGTLQKPLFRTDVVRSVRATLETIMTAGARPASKR